MSQAANNANSAQPPQTRLNQTAAGVSTYSHSGPHPQVLSSRKPGGPAQADSSSVQGYLSSVSRARSARGQQEESTEARPAYNTTGRSDDIGKSAVKNTPTGDPVLTKGSPRDYDNGSQLDALSNKKESSSVFGGHSQAGGAVTASPTSYSFSTNGQPPSNMPRTSSIDSAISNISNTSHAQKQPGDVRDPSQNEVHNLIATAGSAENLIQHLLRDKSHAAAQNAQLWKLVDKQRALLLGLNKDLERVTKERDRYRKKAKDLQVQPSTAQVDRLRTEEAKSPQSDGEVSIKSRDEYTQGSDLRLRGSLETPDRVNDRVQSSPFDPAMMPSPLHLQQSQKLSGLASLSTQLANPIFAVTEATPLSEKPPKSIQTSRKAPPRPLDLRPAKDEGTGHQIVVPAEVLVSDDDTLETLPPVERGRRKTREEDDRDREILALQEQETRSRSKREKKGRPDVGDTAPEQLPPSLTQPEPNHPLPLRTDHHRAQEHLSPPSTASASVGSSGQLSLPVRSPGLPMSPRPLIGSALPMSPRAPGGNFPLSPRAPKAPLPMPTTPGQQAPAPQAQSAALDQQKKIGPSPLVKVNTKSSNNDADPTYLGESPLSPGDIPPVNRGLVDSNWPDLLLPPNALPSVQVKVASSRLRPSRNSILGLKPQDDNSVFSVSVFERATASELWRVEKVPASLASLEQQLRSRCTDLPKLPDRKLFFGHSPAVVDARRSSIDAYFDDLLDTPMDEQAAAIICRFLSADVLDPQLSLPPQNGEVQSKPAQPLQSGVPTKSGYLTKKGKNFGGWKSRYFVLDSPELRYFEAPGGAHLGTIKLLNARIGRQTQSDPSSQPEVDTENQYRHAFLILEPKRKDTNSHVRHVLCAESDAERDEWVETLLYYIDERPTETKSQYGAGVQTSHSRDAKGSQRSGYEETEPKANGSSPFSHGQSDTPSPSNASSHTPEFVQDSAAAPKAFNISGPMNGAVISDAGLWGNKSTGNSGSKDREQKKRNLFHFRKSSHEQLAPVPATQTKKADIAAYHRSGHVRPVFGMQLQEAVEYYSPVDVEVYLPAVVYRCIEYLRTKHAANEEGLFRLSGSNIVIRLLKDRFNTEGDVDLLAEEEEDYDVHAVASLFKTYLRELPATILTRELHIEFLKVLELNDKSQKIAAFNVLVHQLPAANFALLRTLSLYLLEVVQNSERNKMSVKNVGIVFSPTLNIPAPLFAMFLTDFEAIFDKPGDEESIRSTEIEREGALTPEDIRSPRRQMFTDLPTPMYNQNSFSQNTTMPAVMQGQSTLTDYHMDPSSDFGFAPIQPSYETRSYVSIPHEMPMVPRYPPPQPPTTGSTKYGGVNNMLAPDNAASVKAKRRESSMLFM